VDIQLLQSPIPFRVHKSQWHLNPKCSKDQRASTLSRLKFLSSDYLSAKYNWQPSSC